MLNLRWVVRSSALALVGLGMSAVAMGQAASYKIDAEKSVVTWQGKKVAGEHTGTVKIKNGNVVMEGNKLKSGVFVLDMTSIDNNDLSGEWKTKLVDHLKSDDFFNVGKFPTGKFKTTTVMPGKNAGEYNVTGDLTIKDITKPVSFPLTIMKDKAGMATAKADFKIDRLQWDIKYNSGKFFDAKKLGDKMIYDEIGIGFKLAAMPASGTKKTAEQDVKKDVKKAMPKKTSAKAVAN